MRKKNQASKQAQKQALRADHDGKVDHVGSDVVQQVIKLGVEIHQVYGISIGTAVLLAERLMALGINTARFPPMTSGGLFCKLLKYRIPWYGARQVPRQLVEVVPLAGSRNWKAYTDESVVAIFNYMINARPFRRGRRPRALANQQENGRER